MTAGRPRKVVIGLDLGTTAAKALAVAVGPSEGLPWRHVAVREHPLLRPAPDRAVQDPDVLLASATAALAECVAAAEGAEVLAVSLGTAQHALIGLDDAGRPTTPVITWADSRAAEEARELRTGPHGEGLHLRTGTPVHPMSPLTKLSWFARQEPGTLAQARWWVGLKELLVHALTGEVVTELSSASTTGMLDLASRDWDPQAVDLAGVRRDQLPQVRPTTTVLRLCAGAAAATGLPAGTPVVLGAADGPLGNLGTGAIGRGVAGLSLGTSGAVRMVVPRPVTDPDGALFCYALTEDHWVIGGAVSNGGHVVRWAGAALAPDLRRAAEDFGGADEALLALAARVPAGSDGLVMLPFLLPERAPRWDPGLHGAYLGLRTEHTRGHLVRAAVEGVALQLSTVVDRLDRVAPVRSLQVTGGAFRAPLWREVVAAVLARPLHVDAQAQGSALGAAALGLFALGHAGSVEESLGRLAPGSGHDTAAVVPDPELVTAYDAVRTRVPALVSALAGITEVRPRSTSSMA